MENLLTPAAAAQLEGAGGRVVEITHGERVRFAFDDVDKMMAVIRAIKKHPIAGARLRVTSRCVDGVHILCIQKKRGAA